nr:ribonuclease H-like domain-containing protein [Tanacetum cinerariifolium]
MVEGVTLSNSNDRWSWSLVGSGDFSVSSVRKLIDNAILSKGISKTRWIKEDPTTGAWKMDRGASSHLNNLVTSLSDVLNMFIYPSVSIGDGYTIPFVRDNNCTIEFDAFGFSIKDFMSRWVLLRCDSMGDLFSSRCLLPFLIPFLPVSIRGTNDLDIQEEFSMTDLGSLNYFLSMSVARDSSRMFLSQRKYATEIHEQAHMVSCNPSRTSIDTEFKLGADGDPISDPALYQSLAGDENPIRTLGDYSKPSHEGYKNTIELPVENNMVAFRSYTIRERTRLRLFQSSFHDQASNWLERLPAGSITTWEDLTTRFLAQFFLPGRIAKLCNDNLMFQQHHGESLSEAWNHFKALLQKRTIDQSAGGKLRDRNAKESWALLEDLTLYDKESWNDPRDFAKSVKAIDSPQDIPSTPDRRLIELENQVQRLMEARLSLTQPTQVNRVTTSCKICSGPQNTQYCMKYPEQAYVEYASSRNNDMGSWKFTTNQGLRSFKEATNICVSLKKSNKNVVGNFMGSENIASISHIEREELRRKGIKSPSKLFSTKYLSLASIVELNKNPSALKSVHFVNLIVILRSFAYKCDFMILEDTTSIIDRHLGEMVFGRPFIDKTGLVYNREEGMVMFKQGDEKITFIMPHTMEIFKQTRIMGLSTDSIPPSAYEENFSHERTHYYQSLLSGDEYMQDRGDRRGIRHLMRLEKEMMGDKGEVM